jgi:luciferase family oxidoreductase group 1
LDELLAFLDGGFPDSHPFQRIRAMPDDVPMPEIWLLGSSDFSAQLAARLGLRFAFAHHISPWPAVGALRRYCEQFRPSPTLAKPESILAVSVLCAETDERAEELAKPLELTLLRFRQGRMGRFPSEAEAAVYPYTPEDREIIRANRARSFIGSPQTVREQISALAEQADVDEIMITTMTHAHQDRRRSYELVAEAFSLPTGRQLRGHGSTGS